MVAVTIPVTLYPVAALYAVTSQELFPCAKIVVGVLCTIDVVPVVSPVPPLANGSVPETPAVRDTPVQFDRLPEVGVPRSGVTSVGLVDRTVLPDPVEVVTPVPPLATAKGSDRPKAARAVAAETAVKTAMPVVVPPRLMSAPPAVVEPVPPSATASGDATPPVVAGTTSVPLQYMMAEPPCTTVTPVA